MSTAAVTRNGLRYGDTTDPVKLQQFFNDSNLFGPNPSLPKMTSNNHVSFNLKDHHVSSFSDDDGVPPLNDSFSFESAKSFTTENFHDQSSSAEHDDSDTPLMTPSYSDVVSNASSSNVTSPPHHVLNELIVLQESAEKTDDEDLLELSHVSSIEGDLDDILSFNESVYRDLKAVHFLGKPLSVSYSVSADIDPAELKIPESRGGGDGREGINNLLTLQPRNSATTLVDRAVECVAVKLLDLSQRDPIELGADELPTTPPPVQRADSLQTIKLRKDKSRGRGRKLSKVLQYKKSSNRQLLNDVISGLKGTESSAELFANAVLRKQFIRRYIVQSLSMNDKVRFDAVAVTASNGKIVLMDGKGFSKGCYEWSIEILKSDVEAQEIGVVGTSDIATLEVSNQGALKTDAFGARSAYGSELYSNALYYGSFNADGQKRCFRDLNNWYSVGWCVGDVITVRLDLNQHRIRYLLNGKAVRYCMSLEPNKTYYPFVSFSGNCKYYLH